MPGAVIDAANVRHAYERLAARLLAAREDDHWEGHLSSSALSTATAVIALALAREAADDEALAARGLRWLADHQNEDGGWGDTTESVSNISTTALVWSAFAFAPDATSEFTEAIGRCEAWLTRAAGRLEPDALRTAIGVRYGKDRTFSAPILTTLALAGRLGADPWQHVPQLPFELAACPPEWFQRLQLPVVSYALPALIAIGQVRHHQRPSRNPVARLLRDALRQRTSRVLRRIQPSTGGYLEATPLTSFVVMSLAASGQASSPVAHAGLRFLRRSVRDDGSWPIDTHLATWVTSLSINAIAAGASDWALQPAERAAVAAWLLDQQHRVRHPYTNAAPGGWAWTPLAGGVPDADDTAGALVALKRLGVADARLLDAVALGVGWLLDLQNRDGGIPTFCRGWGALPFDRSAPDLTAHALVGWQSWIGQLPRELRERVPRAADRAVRYLAATQRTDGAWLPLWFGNQHAPDEANPTYGTSRVVAALAQLPRNARVAPIIDRGLAWLIAAQNADGGWGGDASVISSIEETAFAVEAIAAALVARSVDGPSRERYREVVMRGVEWLMRAIPADTPIPAAPVGLYFAKLWYHEALYPLIFATAALGRAHAALAE